MNHLARMQTLPYITLFKKVQGVSNRCKDLFKQKNILGLWALWPIEAEFYSVATYTKMQATNLHIDQNFPVPIHFWMIDSKLRYSV